MKTITKRDVLFFFIGFFTMLIIESIYDWRESANGFKDGLKNDNTEVSK
ncbi:MAG: hypothetical protein Q8928_10225 [Bacteroidota bacterium]|nr:hypothetical protein [Bacteroidota bacterium]